MKNTVKSTVTMPKAFSQRVGSEPKALRMRLQMSSRRERDPLRIRRNSEARNLFRRGAGEVAEEKHFGGMFFKGKSLPKNGSPRRTVI